MKLEATLQRSPTDDELAAEMRVTPEQLQALLTQISSLGLVALDETLSSGERGRVLDTRRHHPRPLGRTRHHV